MKVQWLTTFIDRPAAEVAVTFWTLVTGTSISPVRGDRGQFATLLPGDGDAFLRVQTVLEGGGGHLDVHVEDVDGAAARAVELGATASPRDGYVTLLSPAGLRWCLVPPQKPVAGDQLRTPAPIARSGGHRSRVDQLCIDVPPGSFEAECAFWERFTGWPLRATRYPEFAALDLPEGLPLGLLLQRLGDEPADGRAACHLDVAASDAAREVALHESWGASVRERFPTWTTLLDPSGFTYCVVEGDPS